MTGNVIDVAELRQLLEGSTRVRLVDCRFNLADKAAGETAYAGGHLPGAVFADLERDLSGLIVKGQTGRHPLPDVAALAEKLGAWGIDRETRVVAYDDGSCMYAPRLWWLLRWLGHESVSVLRGGTAAWVNAGHALSQTLPELEAKTFVAKVNPALIAELSEVVELATGTRRDSVLLDARGDVRYRGEQEPIDPVAGHIPGALNLPYTVLLQDGGPRAAGDVQTSFAASTRQSASARVVAYCGSGVTACALIWAAESAGLTGIRLYPGSWSEWITDTARPVARGAE